MSEWKALTLGHLSTQRKGINYKSEDYGDEHSGHPFITIKCFVKGGGYEPAGIKFYDGISTKADHLSSGDLLFSVTDLTRAGDIVGSPLRVPDFGVTKSVLASMDCMRIEPIASRCDKRFLYHRLMLSDVRRQMVAYAAGSTVLHLDTKKVPSIFVRIPVDVNLQSRIADILDGIDTTIEKTEALIAKYQQIKAGLMHDLFTRGVLPNGQLRPPRKQAPELYQETAIGWIPRDWRISPLGECLKMPPKNGYSPREVDSWQGLYVLGLGCLTPDGFEARQLKNAPRDAATVSGALLTEGDFLISRANTPELVGLCGTFKAIGAPAIYPDLMMRLKPIDSLNADFLEAQLLMPATRKRLTALAVGTSSSMAKLNAKSVQQVLIAVPAPLEQRAIIGTLSKVVDGIRAYRSAKLKLYVQKQGLMHDLLTGKVPAKVEEPEVGCG